MFVNTIDRAVEQYGEQAVEDMLLTGEFTVIHENRCKEYPNIISGQTNIAEIVCPLVTKDVAIPGKNSMATVKLFSINGAFGLEASGVELLHLPCVQSLSFYGMRNSPNLRTVILSNRHVLCLMYNAVALENTPIANGDGYIYVRKKLLEQYKAATNWSVYAAQIRAIEDYPEIKAIVDADLAEMRGVA